MKEHTIPCVTASTRTKNSKKKTKQPEASRRFIAEMEVENKKLAADKQVKVLLTENEKL